LLESFPEARRQLELIQQRLTALELAGGAGDGPLTLVERTPPTWDGILEARGTVLVGPQTGPLPAVLEGLEEAGYAGPLTLLENPATVRQRARPPAEFSGDDWLLLVGPTRRSPLLEDLPLYGMSLVVTREAKQGEKVRAQLTSLGADVISCPVLAFRQPDDLGPLQSCLKRLQQCDWLLFTSANGVNAFFQALREDGQDLRTLGGVKLGAIGPGTAQTLAEWHLNADCVPQEYVAEGFLAALEAYELEGRRVILARAQEARDVLPEGLRKRGAAVEVVPVYKTILPKVDEEALERARQADWVLLTSSSGARNYAQLVGVSPQKVLAIGPITAGTARGLGWAEVETARQYTLEGMVDLLLGARVAKEEERR
jgi:uroporphyrinogen III methyltransferase/synthase